MPPETSLLATLSALIGEIPGSVADRFRLLSLEVRRAGRSLALMIMLMIAAAILATTAWLALWAGLSVAAVRAGAPWLVVLLTVIAINLGAAWFALQRARSLIVHLALPATVRRLGVNPATKPAEARVSSQAAAARAADPAASV